MNMQNRKVNGWKGVVTATLAAGALFATGAAVGAAMDHEGSDSIGTGGPMTVTAAAPAVAAFAAQPATPAPVTPKTERPAEARALSQAFKAAAKAVRPSVVRIDVEMEKPKLTNGKGRFKLPEGGEGDVPEPLRRFFHQFGDGDGEGPDLGDLVPHPSGTGSGFIIDGAGHIVTNRHVVDSAQKVTVTLQDGRELSAKVVGKDARTDVAVIKLDNPPKDLVAARVGDSEKLEVGEWVLAIGSPLGMEQTVTVGIVSGKGKVGPRMRMSGDRVRNYIQTDAKINPGNSGGPLLTLDGEVIGVNTLINAGPGGAYGFAIPINEAKRIADTLVRDGRVRYAFLGIQMGDVKSPEAMAKLEKAAKEPPKVGAFVAKVVPGAPADKLGLRPGDVITKLDDQKVEGADDVVTYVSSKPIGAKINVGYWREGKTLAGSTVLGEMPSDDDRVAQAAGDGSAPAGLVGIAVQTLTPDMAKSLGMPAGTKGAAITDVISGSPAERAGLKPGDVVIEVDRKPVITSDQAVAALRADTKAPHLLRVRNGANVRFVTVKAE